MKQMESRLNGLKQKESDYRQQLLDMENERNLLKELKVKEKARSLRRSKEKLMRTFSKSNITTNTPKTQHCDKSETPWSRKTVICDWK